MSLHCTKCQLPIEIDDVISLKSGAHFHQECFACTYCSKGLTSKFAVKSGKYYHVDCYAKVKAAKKVDECVKCKKRIDQTAIRVEIGKPKQCYHRECFNCDHCGQFISDGFIGSKLGSAIYHDTCLECSECNAPLAGLNYEQLLPNVEQYMCKHCAVALEKQKPQSVQAVLSASPSKQMLKSGSTLSLTKRLASEHNLANTSNMTSTDSLFKQAGNLNSSQDNIAANNSNYFASPVKKSDRDLNQADKKADNIALLSNILENLESAGKSKSKDTGAGYDKLTKSKTIETLKSIDAQKVQGSLSKSASKFSLDELLSDLEEVQKRPSIVKVVTLQDDSVKSPPITLPHPVNAKIIIKPTATAKKSVSIEDILGEMKLDDVDVPKVKQIPKSLSVKAIIDDLDTAENELVDQFELKMRKSTTVPANMKADSLTALAMDLENTFEAIPMPPAPLADKSRRMNLKQKDETVNASHGTLALERMSMFLPAGLTPPPPIAAKTKLNDDSNLMRELKDTQFKRANSSESLKQASNYTVVKTNKKSDHDSTPATPRISPDNSLVAPTSKSKGNDTQPVYSKDKESISHNNDW